MSKLKGFLTVVLALALIIAGACFPKAVSSFLDRKNTGIASVNPIESIRFELDEEIQPIGKLAILSRAGGSIEISESKAKMTKEEVMAAVYEGIRPYIEANLILYSEKEIRLYPGLIQAKDDRDLQSIAWFVEITGDPAVNYTLLQLIVDDDTGKILMISFSHENLEGTIVGQEALAVFADIYFTSLGIESYIPYAIDDLEYAYAGEKACAIRYSFDDAVYGEVNVDLYAYPYGFYVEFPNATTQIDPSSFFE